MSAKIFERNLTYLAIKKVCHFREEANRRRCVELARKIYNGDKQAVRELIVSDMGRPITDFGETVLHVAIKAEQDEIAKELAYMMSETDLQKKDCNGHTALSFVAFQGRTNLAKVLVPQNRGLLTIVDNAGNIPLTRACGVGHKEMTNYLYKETLHYIKTFPHYDVLQPGIECNHGFHLMRCCIANKMFDICWDLLKKYPSLAVCVHTRGESPILMLSRQPSAFYSGTRLSAWQRLIYQCLKVELPITPTTPTKDVQLDVDQTPTSDVTIQGYGKRSLRKRVFYGLVGLGLKVQEFFGVKHVSNLKLRHRYAHKVLCCMCKHVSALELNYKRDDYGVGAALFEATKQGIVEFVTELCKANPSIGFKVNDDDRLAFMVAVQHRQENVFNLIYGANEAWKAENLNKSDIDGNNILHVAGGLAPEFERGGISSPALQMQRELQWFKEVERIVPEWCKEAKNNNGENPKDVFTESHKGLLKEGEKWMTDTASSFIILSILLVTIMFAVSFTVPGGDNQNNGLPILLGKKLFKIFIITDAISFFAASTSGLIFLGILTSRKAEEDFLLSLPRKLMIGLITLFISIATMMASFSAALLIMLQVQLWALILITLAAVIPTMVFGWLQFPLICEIIVSTCSQGIFNRKMKPWLVNLQ
ncbi:hypothetical protein SLEP1_g37734 [Rubroshorea leprosula]|uniref:PGG domain-containing protein n=1 Tax=Rubroshorea leprosula TaxID=152421 RepID=A0AAV5KW93_9ROSI|nr:hypothetical protein SLEP1_g37734 [Rubroshorea leprosula]